MRGPSCVGRVVLLALLCAAGESAGAPTRQREARRTSVVVDPRTRVDHDSLPIAQPAEHETSFYGHQYREAFVEPLSHAFDVPDKFLGSRKHRDAVNVNAFDDVPNSTWFTARNHVRAVSLAEMGRGALDHRRPVPPYTIKAAKRGGQSAGFQIKDTKGVRWVVKLDPAGFPQLSSGADVIVARLYHAAGFNVPHDVGFTFRRDELKIDEDLLSGKEGAPFTQDDLDRVLARGAIGSEGQHYALASEYLPGTPVGAIDFRRRRRDDENDWYTHRHRRELRALGVLSAWVGSWDTKDHNSLDMFAAAKDKRGHVVHYLVDLGGALGAQATGPKELQSGYEMTLDWKWMARRFVTLGFVEEPWRREVQVSDIPSVGNFGWRAFDPGDFRPQQPHAAFREMTTGDGYWGAKIVASFSDAQIAAAIDAAAYEDPRAKPYLLEALVQRRNRIVNYWFSRVAPLDFFVVSGDDLRFHDLGVDVGQSPSRSYVAVIDTDAGPARHLTMTSPHVPLDDLDGGTRRVAIRIRPAGSEAAPVRVDLERSGGRWTIVRVRHA